MTALAALRIDMQATARLARRVLIVALALVVAIEVYDSICVVFYVVTRPAGRDLIGQDYGTYMGAASRWLSGHGFYLGYQLAGPYDVVLREVLYPPTALPLFAVFSILPAPVWWLIPAAVTGWIVWSWRPSRLGWLIIAGILAYRMNVATILAGNPNIWVLAFVAVGTRYGWAFALVALKPSPSFLPFALVGIRSRGWWIATGVLALVSLAMLPLWIDYVTVLWNARTGMDPLYAFGSAPLMATPLVARVLSTRSEPFRLAARRVG